MTRLRNQRGDSMKQGRQQAIPKFDGRNVPVSVAASIMRKDAQFIRIGLQRGLLPIGTAYKVNDSNTQYDYYISPSKLYEFTGYVYKDAVINESEV